jgi:hypothetical protein
MYLQVQYKKTNSLLCMGCVMSSGMWREVMVFQMHKMSTVVMHKVSVYLSLLMALTYSYIYIYIYIYIETQTAEVKNFGT